MLTPYERVSRLHLRHNKHPGCRATGPFRNTPKPSQRTRALLELPSAVAAPAVCCSVPQHWVPCLLSTPHGAHTLSEQGLRFRRIGCLGIPKRRPARKMDLRPPRLVRLTPPTQGVPQVSSSFDWTSRQRYGWQWTTGSGNLNVGPVRKPGFLGRETLNAVPHRGLASAAPVGTRRSISHSKDRGACSAGEKPPQGSSRSRQPALEYRTVDLQRDTPVGELATLAAEHLTGLGNILNLRRLG